MIEMKDFVATMQKQINDYLLDETSGKIQQIAMNVAVDIYDKEKCKEWIKQAMEIETYSEQQIEDLAIRHLIDKKNAEIKYLENQNWELRQELQELKERNGEW